MPGTKDSNPIRSLRLNLEGANANASMTGLQPIPGKANYLIGNDAAQWRRNVPLFARVQVDEVYPGVRLVYYANDSAQLEYDFIVQPNTEPGRILFHVEGVDRMQVNGAGDLVLQIAGNEIRQRRPVIYQNVSGSRKLVEGGYRLIDHDRVGFQIGSYDRSLPLVIDPTISFSTYLGGTKTDNAWAIAVDANGDVYVTGETLSLDFALPGAFQPVFNGGIRPFGDAFVAKYDGLSDNLVYLTYLGGAKDDGALGIAVTNGNAFVTGFTDSRNFPLLPAINPISPPASEFGRTNNAFHVFPINAFVTELATDGASLVFSTLLGGRVRDVGTCIALDDTGIYVAGMTESTNFFPQPNGVQLIHGGNEDAFIVKLDYTGTSMIAGTFLGGTNTEFAEDIAVDSSRNVYITGFTSSTNFPTVNPLVITNTNSTNTLNRLNQQPKQSSHIDAFVAKFNDTLTSLIYSSYLGGTNDEAGLGIAVDSGGNAYVTGFTMSLMFPTNTIAAPQSSGASKYSSHAFLTKIGPLGGSDVPYSVDFGSSKSDQATGIKLNESAQQIYLTGITSWTNFFATNVFTDLRSTNAAAKKAGQTQNDVFVAVVQETSPTTIVFTNSVIFGGIANDQANALALSTSGTNVTAYIAGQTTSKDLPLINAPQTILGNGKKSKGIDAFVTKILFP